MEMKATYMDAPFLVVWGAGENGIKLARILRKYIISFIDMNEEKIGTVVEGIPVISYEKYKTDYRNFYILVSPQKDASILKMIREEGICKYFTLKDCSLDIQNFTFSDNDWKKLLSNVKKDDMTFIYGLTLTSVLLCIFLKQNGYSNLQIISHDNTKSILREKISKDFGVKVTSELSETNKADTVLLSIDVMHGIVNQVKNYGNSYVDGYESNTDPLLDAVEVRRGVYENLKRNSNKMLAVYDMKNFGYIEHWRKEIKKFKSCHRGKRCFIIGNGPSLSPSDLSMIYDHDEISMGVNGIFFIFTDTEWRPTYYLAGDPVFFELYGDYFKTSIAKQKFFCQMVGQMQGHDPFEGREKDFNICRYYLHWPTLGFTDDFFIAYPGGTIVYICLELAIYMGFQEIYLLGVDFNYNVNEKGTAHFSEKYRVFGEHKNRTQKDFEDDFKKRCYYDMLTGYHIARKYADEHGISIFNATRGGNLEVFKRVNFDDLF